MKRTLPIATAVVAVFCMTALAGRAHPRTHQDVPPAAAVEDPEAYAVYAAVLPAGPDAKRREPTRYVVRRESVRCTLTGEPEDPAWRPVIANYATANAQPRVLREGFSLGRPYTVVPQAEIAALFVPVEQGWARFYERYAGVQGYDAMSAVGFDTAKTLAVVSVENHCHYLCGHGRTVFLRKTSGTWQPTAVPGVQGCQWVS